MCQGCGDPYKGFGAVCAPCRKKPAAAVTSNAPDASNAVAPDHCEVCRKRVYVMESLQAEGSLFHKDCFKCTTCGRKLGGTNFAKNELGFFCMPHFQQITKVTGGYRTGTGPTRNAAAASLVEAMVHRESVGHEGVVASFNSGNTKNDESGQETQTAEKLSEKLETGVEIKPEVTGSTCPAQLDDEVNTQKQCLDKPESGIEQVSESTGPAKVDDEVNTQQQRLDKLELGDNGDVSPPATEQARAGDCHENRKDEANAGDSISDTVRAAGSLEQCATVSA